MIRPLMTVTTFAAALIVSAQPNDAPAVPEILRKAIASSPHQRYFGHLVREFRHGAEVDKHEEIVFRDGQWTRIEFPEGSKFTGQVIVENHRDRRHYFPDRNVIEVMPARREEALGRLARLAKSGQKKLKISLGPGEVVAGFKTEQVVVSDNEGNVLQRIFIEPKTGTLLKRKLFDPVGAPVGSFEFTQFSPNGRIDPSLFTLGRKGAKVVTPDDKLQDLCTANGFVFAKLSESSGYRLEHCRINKVGGDEVLMQIYSSGPDKLSLFQSRSGVNASRMERFAKDEFHVFTWNREGKTYTLVGRVTDERLQDLARLVGPGTGQ